MLEPTNDRRLMVLLEEEIVIEFWIRSLVPEHLKHFLYVQCQFQSGRYNLWLDFIETLRFLHVAIAAEWKENWKWSTAQSQSIYYQHCHIICVFWTFLFSLNFQMAQMNSWSFFIKRLDLYLVCCLIHVDFNDLVRSPAVSNFRVHLSVFMWDFGKMT